MDINNIIREEVLKQQAYTTEDASFQIKLDANENPFKLPESLKEKLAAGIKEISLNRYPQPGAPELKKQYSQYYGVSEDMIMVGNGSDELIQILCNTMARKNSCILVPVPTFTMYKIIGLNCGQEVIEVPLDMNFDLDVDTMLDIINNRRPALVFLSYPNNPTGNCFSRDKVEEIIRQSSGVVVLDEAYANFSGKTFLPDLCKYDNLVILKTLSKVGLAAMRIGFLIARPLLIQELNKVRLPYNLNTLSQLAALFYLDEKRLFSNQTTEIIRQRDILFNELKNIEGIIPYPSDANFIFFSCTFDTYRVYDALIQNGILIKAFGKSSFIKDFMRVTVGTSDENRAFISALKRIVAQVRSVV